MTGEGSDPERPRGAARGAWGGRAGAALTLVAEVAEEGPLLCLADDAQWLDEASAQVLAFVARRVSAERVALLFGLRDAGAGGDGPLAGLPELRLTGLGEADAPALLAVAVRTHAIERLGRWR